MYGYAQVFYQNKVEIATEIQDVRTLSQSLGSKKANKKCSTLSVRGPSLNVRI